MEEQAEYITQEEVQEALDMLGKGYDEPSIEIEQPREVVERRNGKLVEAARPAFVKIYTSFKSEMKDIDEIALKVWLYIALSVNRFTDEAHPGLRTIAEETGFAVNTVRAAIERLETKYNLLTVERGERKYNRYFPLDYVSAKRNEAVSPDDTGKETVSGGGESVSDKPKTVSPKMILNQINQTLEPNREEEGVNPLFSFYENKIGALSPIMADAIEKAEKVYTSKWVADAIELASKNGARHWNYCEKVLDRWKREGRAEKKADPKQRAAVNPSKYVEGQYAQYIEH